VPEVQAWRWDWAAAPPPCSGASALLGQFSQEEIMAAICGSFFAPGNSTIHPLDHSTFFLLQGWLPHRAHDNEAYTAQMIEITLELKLDSFLVNSTGDSGDLLDYMPAKAVRFSCEKIASSRPLIDNTPSADFEFLNSSSKNETKIGFDKEFDDQFLKFLAIQDTIEISKVVIAPEPPDHRKKPEGVSSSEIGRMFFTKLPGPKGVDLTLELFLKHDELEDVWKITTQQNIQKIIATLVCFKLKQDGLSTQNKSTFVAGVLSGALRMMPKF